MVFSVRNIKLVSVVSAVYELALEPSLFIQALHPSDFFDCWSGYIWCSERPDIWRWENFALHPVLIRRSLFFPCIPKCHTRTNNGLAFLVPRPTLQKYLKHANDLQGNSYTGTSCRWYEVMGILLFLKSSYTAQESTSSIPPPSAKFGGHGAPHQQTRFFTTVSPTVRELMVQRGVTLHHLMKQSTSKIGIYHLGVPGNGWIKSKRTIPPEEPTMKEQNKWLLYLWICCMSPMYRRNSRYPPKTGLPTHMI